MTTTPAPLKLTVKELDDQAVARDMHITVDTLDPEGDDRRLIALSLAIPQAEYVAAALTIEQASQIAHAILARITYLADQDR